MNLGRFVKTFDFSIKVSVLFCFFLKLSGINSDLYISSIVFLMFIESKSNVTIILNFDIEGVV